MAAASREILQIVLVRRTVRGCRVVGERRAFVIHRRHAVHSAERPSLIELRAVTTCCAWKMRSMWQKTIKHNRQHRPSCVSSHLDGLPAS
jgi:hypothetical protein